MVSLPAAIMDVLPPRTRAHNWVTTSIAILAVGITIAATFLSGGGPAPGRFWSTDISGALGPVFHPGVILGAGSNSTDTLLAGIGVYTISPEFSLPVLADVHVASSGPVVRNLTSEVDPYFYLGGTYALGWNGSAWLVGGQATWGGVNDGTLVALTGSTFTNVTSLIYPYFAGGGIFAMGWNGTAWLIGGNSSAGVVLVSLQGARVTDLTNVLPQRDPFGWIQLLAWNGREWMIGGERVLGTYEGATFHDLLPGSPFVTSGVYSGGWNGTAWVVGGGGGVAVVIRDDLLYPGPDLPTAFDQSVLLVISYPNGWIVGGKGTAPSGVREGELVTWSGGAGAAGVQDLRSLIPTSFAAGELQGGCWAPEFGLSQLLIVGEGSYNAITGYGSGTMARVAVP